MKTALAVVCGYLAFGLLVRVVIGLLVPNWVTGSAKEYLAEILLWPWMACALRRRVVKRAGR